MACAQIAVGVLVLLQRKTLLWGGLSLKLVSSLCSHPLVHNAAFPGYKASIGGVEGRSGPFE